MGIGSRGIGMGVNSALSMATAERANDQIEFCRTLETRPYVSFP